MAVKYADEIIVLSKSVQEYFRNTYNRETKFISNGVGFGAKYIRLGEKMAVKYADEIIVLSKSVQEYFRNTYNRETKFISNGVNRPESQPADLIKKEYGLKKDDYILYLGRIVPEKGEHYLVEAFKKIHTNRPESQPADLIKKEYGLKKDDYILYLGRIVPEKGEHYLVEAFKKIHTEKKLVIAGGASDTDEYMEKLKKSAAEDDRILFTGFVQGVEAFKKIHTEKKLVIAGGASDTDEYMEKLKKSAAEDDRILFTGFVQGRLLEELYSNAYVYCLPSDLEGMPLSLLEAMSYGCCCLTSDIAECKEVVEDKAVLFKKGKVQDLKDKLQFLCDHEQDVESYKINAADFVCKKYNWDKVVEQTEKLYAI